MPSVAQGFRLLHQGQSAALAETGRVAEMISPTDPRDPGEHSENGEPWNLNDLCIGGIPHPLTVK